MEGEISIWLFRAGADGEYENKFLNDGRIYLTWNDLNIDLKDFKEKTKFYEVLVNMYDLKTDINKNQLYAIKEVFRVFIMCDKTIN